jgi:hypothetical protein
MTLLRHDLLDITPADFFLIFLLPSLKLELAGPVLSQDGFKTS